MLGVGVFPPLSVEATHFNQPNHGVPAGFSVSVAIAPNNRGLYDLANRPPVDLAKIHSLSDYQDFITQDWKTKHGTYDSVERFCDKLHEEIAELREALRGTSNSRDHDILSEIGDVLFCTLALASNSSADLDISVKDNAYQYYQGVRIFGPDPQQTTIWHPAMGRIALATRPIEIREIDGLMNMGFEPLVSKIMNIDSINPEFPDMDLGWHRDMLSIYAGQMFDLAERQYDFGKTEPEILSLSVDYYNYARRIGQTAADMVLESAYLTHKILPKSNLADVIAMNVTKVSGRVAAARVDKTDGERADDLL